MRTKADVSRKLLYAQHALCYRATPRPSICGEHVRSTQESATPLGFQPRPPAEATHPPPVPEVAEPDQTSEDQNRDLRSTSDCGALQEKSTTPCCSHLSSPP
ncbi:hypothetical protein INR49_009478 [Caranx melampygus]|nr:hypothetical protein INR49_009478 [Caranx melampygus]